MKYTPPPFTAPLVAIAQIDKIVNPRMRYATTSNIIDKAKPALPTMYPTRRNRRELNMERATGENTPANVPIVDWVHSTRLVPSLEVLPVKGYGRCCGLKRADNLNN